MYNQRFNKLFRTFDLFDELFFSDLRNDNFIEKNFKSPDGSMSISYFVKTNQKNTIDDLKHQLNLAVENQEFEKAVELRDKIKKLEENKEVISQLKKELDECVKSENYEKAIELRDKIKSLT